MLWSASFLLFCQFAVHGLGLPVDPQDAGPPQALALTNPVQCRQDPSPSSNVTKQYTTVEDLFSSLAGIAEVFGDEDDDGDEEGELDLDDLLKGIEEDEDGWLPTDDRCFISGKNALKAVPAAVLQQLYALNPEANGLQRRWLGIAIKLLVRGAKLLPKFFKGSGKIVKNTGKGKWKDKVKEQAKKNCKRGEPGCGGP